MGITNISGGDNATSGALQQMSMKYRLLQKQERAIDDNDELTDEQKAKKKQKIEDEITDIENQQAMKKKQMEKKRNEEQAKDEAENLARTYDSDTAKQIIKLEQLMNVSLKTDAAQDTAESIDAADDTDNAVDAAVDETDKLDAANEAIDQVEESNTSEIPGVSAEKLADMTPDEIRQLKELMKQKGIWVDEKA